jgi:hypothetical protein
LLHKLNCGKDGVTEKEGVTDKSSLANCQKMAKIHEVADSAVWSHLYKL